MPDDYYDAAPRRVPRIPIALCGFFGSGHDQVGLALGSLTGLPATHLAEWIEHDEGASTASIVRTVGLERFREIERDTLGRALRATPPGVVILGVSTSLSDANLEAIATGAALVFVFRSREKLMVEIRRRNDVAPGSMSPWIPAGDVDDTLVDQMYEVMLPRYERAVLRVDATDATPQEVAREIIDHFELWSPDSD